MEQRIDRLIGQTLALVPHFHPSIGKQAVDALVICANPHRAVLGLQHVAGVIAGKAFRRTEHRKLSIPELGNSGIQETHPEAAFAVLEKSPRATVARQPAGNAIKIQLAAIQPCNSVPVKSNPECTVVIRKQGGDLVPRKTLWESRDAAVADLRQTVGERSNPDRPILNRGESDDGVARQSVARGEGAEAAVVEAR